MNCYVLGEQVAVATNKEEETLLQIKGYSKVGVYISPSTSYWEDTMRQMKEEKVYPVVVYNVDKNALGEVLLFKSQVERLTALWGASLVEEETELRVLSLDLAPYLKRKEWV